MATYTGYKYTLLELKHKLKELRMSVRIALKSKCMKRPSSHESLYIAMVDGEAFHGGMCDRFKGIVSLYAYCKQHHYPFRIYYTFPFRLENFLVPADYDWTLREGEYSDNPRFVRVLYMVAEHYARRLLNLRTKRQVHFYTNRNLLPRINEAYHGNTAGGEDYDWGKLFHELFKPREVLQQRIDSIHQEIGGDYDAAVFRFQNLLGDFSEYHFKALEDKSEAEKLICTCMEYVRKLVNTSPHRRVLVTSDSITFLRRVSQIGGVYVIRGTLFHIDGSKNIDVSSDHFETYLKSFLDFYMISRAQCVYRVCAPLMYPSEFPYYAALVNHRPFESVTL